MKRLPLLLTVVVLSTIASLPIAGQIPPDGGAAQYVADLAARRARTMAALGPQTVLVMWSAPTRVFSLDVDYEYRQESNLLYLTGVDQPETILVLLPGATTRKASLFVRQADPLRELWYGHILTPPEVSARSGIADVYQQRVTEAFQSFMDALLSGAVPKQVAQPAPNEFSALFDALHEGQAKLAILDSADERPIPSLGADAAPHDLWAREMIAKHRGVSLVSAGDVLSKQRTIKTAYEQTVLTHGVDISAEAHIAGMRAARPGRWEYEVEAAIESWFHSHGEMSWGYPSIVASGPNATTLHYLASTRQMLSGDLLLVDAAGNYQGLTGDITRTYPVNGKFSPAQRQIYDLVLRAQEAGIAAAKPGARAEDITRAVRAVFADGLTTLGLMTKASEPEREAQIDLWFPHGPTHGIGMDVHEPVSILEPGTAFVIEPGLYIRPDALDRVPPWPNRAAFIAAVKPALDRYRNIGVRIEDSFLMTAKGPTMLSRRAPRQVADIEKIVGKGR